MSSNFTMPTAAVLAEIPRDVRFQIVPGCAEPPSGDGWLHEIKHDGHRLLAIIAGGELRLMSRNGHDRTKLFHAPFQPLAAAGLPAMVLDGEIAVPDERGVTHIDGLTEAVRERSSDRLAYFVGRIRGIATEFPGRAPAYGGKALGTSTSKDRR